MEERTYQGFVYRRNGPGEPWQRVGPAPDAPQSAPGGGIVIGTPDQVQQQRDQTALAIERARLQAQQATNANAELERARLEAQVALAQAQANNANNGGPQRYMSDKTAGELEDQVKLTLGMQRHLSNFNPDFSGNRVTGGLENSIQGMFSGFGTPGQRAWWSDFQTTDNLIRNSLFGASLTDGERAAYERTTVDPSMDPVEVRRNLEQRAEILIGALTRRTNYLRASNYNPQQIEAALGEAAPLVLPEARPPALPENYGASANIPQQQQAMAAPQAPADPFGQGGPVVLPTARGARPDAGIGASGVVDRASGQGMETVPELVGLGNEIAGLIQQGATRQQVLAHYQARMDRAGIVPSMAQVQVINEVMQKHQQFPNAPVTSLADGWDNFQMRPTADTGGSMLGRFAASDLGAGTISALNAMSGGALRGFGNNDMQAVLDLSAAASPEWAMGGDVLGTATALMGGSLAAGGIEALGTRMAGRGGLLGRFGSGVARAGQIANNGGGIALDMGYGATRGAVETDGPIQDKLLAAGLGAAAAGGGNLAGQGVVNAAARATRGVVNPSVRYLAERGITMSPGQLLGNTNVPGKIFNALESTPVIGSMFGARRAESVGDYARAQLAENLSPISYQPPTGRMGENLPFSQDMLAHAQDAAYNSYNFLQGRSFTADPTELANIRSIVDNGRTIPRIGEELGYIYDNNIAPNIDANGNFTGATLQDALQQLRTAGSSFARNEGAMGNAAAGVTSQLEDALNGIVARQAPDVAPQLQAANAAWRGLVPIENAAITGVNNGGLFTPAQYGRSAVNNTRRFGGRSAAARGDFPGSELQRHAQGIIPSTVPDSGTVNRLMTNVVLPAALPAVLSGGAAYVNPAENPGTAATLGTLAFLSTRRGGRMLQSALIGGAKRQRLGNLMLRNQDLGGLLGASVATPLMLSTSP